MKKTKNFKMLITLMSALIFSCVICSNSYAETDISKISFKVYLKTEQVSALLFLLKKSEMKGTEVPLYLESLRFFMNTYNDMLTKKEKGRNIRFTGNIANNTIYFLKKAKFEAYLAEKYYEPVSKIDAELRKHI